MAELSRQPGRALRVYQIALILAIGWFVGRAPGLLAENQQEKRALGAALGVVAPAVEPATADGSLAGQMAATANLSSESQLVADVAARVAIEVADRTVARLIEAGWGPGTALPQPRATAAPGAYPSESVVRLIVEQAPPQVPAATVAGWSLPAQAAASAATKLPASAVPALVPVTPTEQADGRVLDDTEVRAHAIAASGYEALRAGDRRHAVVLLDEAVRTAPQAVAARQWQADSRQLTRRLSVAGYVLTRSDSEQDPLAASPVLGGAQMGAAVGYMLNPLDDARISILGRIAAAMGQRGAVVRETTEAAIGVRVQPSRGIPIALDVERRIALGIYARNAWAARISGGADRTFQAGGRPWRLQGYGEAGAIGLHDTAYYAGGQAVLATPLLHLGRMSMDGGGGVWGATQRNTGLTVSRFDLGPSARFSFDPWPFHAQLDYRVKAAGNAQPGSGPVLTVSGEF